MHPFLLSKVFRPQAGWYRGELHAHSSLSDGYHPPSKLVEVAKTEGLDFLAITDHNRIDAFPRFDPDPDLLIMPGIEITLQNGHFNIYGVEGWSDWMENICIGMLTIKLAGKYRTTTELMRRTASQGLINSINHPFRGPGEWQDDTTELRYVHCLEILNKPDWPDDSRGNPRAVTLWTRLLNAGYRITAIGGSDHHVLEVRPGEKRHTERLGWPRNYIYAEQLSGAAILAGLRQHRVYVSMGPEVSFRAQFDGSLYDIGADMGDLRGTITFSGSVSECSIPASAQIVKDGQPVAEFPVHDGQARIQFSDRAVTSHSAWYRFEVFDENGQMLVMTNPIFVGPGCAPKPQTFGDFVRDL